MKTIAHRGYSSYSENILSAINLAHKHNFDGVEIDVQTTADENVILFHIKFPKNYWNK